MSHEMELVECLYARFNAREIEAVLCAMDKDVVWANGMEGGHVHGREAVRSYWTRQWAMVDPHVEPVEVTTTPQGEMVVKVHLVVHDRNGTLLSDRMVTHVFQMANGAIQ